MNESIHKYFQVGTIQWMSYPKSAPMDSLKAICRDDFFDAIELKGYADAQQLSDAFCRGEERIPALRRDEAQPAGGGDVQDGQFPRLPIGSRDRITQRACYGDRFLPGAQDTAQDFCRALSPVGQGQGHDIRSGKPLTQGLKKNPGHRNGVQAFLK